MGGEKEEACRPRETSLCVVIQARESRNDVRGCVKVKLRRPRETERRTFRCRVPFHARAHLQRHPPQTRGTLTLGEKEQIQHADIELRGSNRARGYHPSQDV